MKSMSRIWMALVVGVSLGLTLMWVSPVKAGPLTITTTDWKTFSAYLGDPVADPLLDYFDFYSSDETMPSVDGEVISAVYHGKGAATGLYVYLYQLKLYSTSSAGYMSGIAFNFGTPVPPAVVDRYHVYTIPDAPILFGAASPNTNLSDAVWTRTITTSQVSFNLALYRDDNDSGRHDPTDDTDPPYEDVVSYVWAFFHQNPPQTIEANLKDGGPDLLKPKVYTPSPEPSAILLLSLGLLGLAKFRRRMA